LLQAKTGEPGTDIAGGFWTWRHVALGLLSVQTITDTSDFAARNHNN
jgi:hypothetical protein